MYSVMFESCFYHNLFSGAECLQVEFDRMCSTERNHDPLIIMDSQGRHLSTRSGESSTSHRKEISIVCITEFSSSCSMKIIKPLVSHMPFVCRYLFPSYSHILTAI